MWPLVPSGNINYQIVFYLLLCASFAIKTYSMIMAKISIFYHKMKRKAVDKTL